MIDLNKEAEEYTNNWEEITNLDYEDTSPIKCSKIDFIAGANSKYVQAKIIQAQIDVLENIIIKGLNPVDATEQFLILKQQLRQLEDETNNK